MREFGICFVLVQDEALKKVCVQVCPSKPFDGTSHETFAPDETNVAGSVVLPTPYETFSNCAGNVGAYSLSTVLPSGAINPRYSPPLLRAKFVCSCCVGSRLSWLDANTTR